jgi:hypothetical protein
MKRNCFLATLTLLLLAATAFAQTKDVKFQWDQNDPQERVIKDALMTTCSNSERHRHLTYLVRFVFTSFRRVATTASSLRI